MRAKAGRMKRVQAWVKNLFDVSTRASSTFALATGRLLGVTYLAPRTLRPLARLQLLGRLAAAPADGMARGGRAHRLNRPRAPTMRWSNVDELAALGRVERCQRRCGSLLQYWLPCALPGRCRPSVSATRDRRRLAGSVLVSHQSRR